jgi:hypothetical protein
VKDRSVLETPRPAAAEFDSDLPGHWVVALEAAIAAALPTATARSVLAAESRLVSNGVSRAFRTLPILIMAPTSALVVTLAVVLVMTLSHGLVRRGQDRRAAAEQTDPEDRCQRTPTGPFAGKQPGQCIKLLTVHPGPFLTRAVSIVLSVNVARRRSMVPSPQKRQPNRDRPRVLNGSDYADNSVDHVRTGIEAGAAGVNPGLI